MPRLRTPSLKVRQNQEEFTSPSSPPPSTSRAAASSTRAARASVTKTPATTTPARGRGRPRGRPRGSTASGPRNVNNTVKRPRGRPRTVKRGDPWEDDAEEINYGYESYTSSSSSEEEEEEEEHYTVRAVEPREPAIEEEDVEHHHDDSFIKPDPCADDLEGPILCPWLELEPEQIPPLILPESSQDIPLFKEYVMDMIEMYEILRSYSRTLRLSPFIFEDFCAAMSSPDNSCLLSEIHIALLKACWRSDDEEQVHYSANDTNNAVNIAYFSMDSMTYAEVLRLYLEGDRARNRVPVEILTAINTPNYPFVAIDIRASVITYLCYRFLDTTEYKKIVNTLGKFTNEDVCRTCLKGGGLMHCDTCELSFHPHCYDLDVKNETFMCRLCTINEVKGVSSCLPIDQTQNKQPLRMTPIGRDRHGRLYWFVARRIVVQEEADNGPLHYYSTAPQLYELVSALDPTFFEYALCKTLCERLGDILEQMAVTLELTTERRDIIFNELQSKGKPTPASPYLHIDNLFRMHEILKDNSQDFALKQEIKEEEDEHMYQPLPKRMLPLLGICDGRLTNNFWSGHFDEQRVISFDPSSTTRDPAELFCMGQFKFDDIFRKYKNTYALHDHGEALAVKKKTGDRKKYLSTRFSIFDEGEDAFKWSMAKGKDMYGPDRQQAKYLEWTIAKLVKKIPVEMMHRRWPEVADQWRKDLPKSENYEHLASMLLRAESCMRRTLFLPQFWNSLGLTRWTRTTLDDRDQISKDIQKRKKEEKDMASPDFTEEGMIKVNYTRLPSKACPQGLWRQKDELFRLGGRWELGGWMWVSKTFTRRIGPAPEAPPLGLAGRSFAPEQIENPAVKKALCLESLVKKLSGWRKNEEMTKKNQALSRCYSPSCRAGIPRRLVCGDEDLIFQSCYSQRCRSALLDEIPLDFGSTSAVVKARDTSRFAPLKNGVTGEGDVAWPLNKPTSFVSRGSQVKSILMIPDIILRKLARQGGRVAMYVPNFSMSAKSNYSLWNYPCFRPCFDLCWKWQTTNACSLQAVSLQLKILWFCIKWTEFLVHEDDSEDGRVIIHHPDRDELRQVIDHKEFPPQGTYERYKLRVESFMLDDEGDDDDYNERADRKRNGRSNNRPKRSAAMRSQRKNPTRYEWIDGVELKVSEIRAYWEQRIARPPSPKNELIFSKNIISLKDLQRSRPSYSSLLQQPQTPTFVSSPVAKYYNMQPGPSNGVSALADRRKRMLTSHRDFEDGHYDDQMAGSEPAAKKHRVLIQPSFAYTPRVAYSALNTQVLTDSPTRRTSSGYEFNGGMIRGGGRVQPQPVGDGMRRVMGTAGGNIPSVAAEETVTTTSVPRASAGGNESDDLPPVITRYDSSTSGQPPPQTRPATAARQVMYSAATTQSRAAAQTAANGKVLMIRRHDGTTQYLRPVPKDETGAPAVRTVTVGGQSGLCRMMSTAAASGAPVRRVVATVGGRSGTVVRTVAAPTRIVRLGPGGQQVMSTIPAGSRIVTRVPANGRASPAQPVLAGSQNLRRPAPPRQMQGDFIGDEGNEYGQPARAPVARVGPSFGYGRQVQRVVSRGGSTMHVGQRMVQVRGPSQYPQESYDDDGFRRGGPPNGRRVTSYRDFCMKRGIMDFMRLPTRPYRFDFESNEDEERAIAEAIAREEELMRQEEEDNKRDHDRQWNHPRIIDKFGQVGSAMLHQLSKQPLQFSSNLMPARDDTSDMKQIKQTLDSLLTQVCRWDKQYGWFKQHQKRPKGRMDLEKLKTRRMFSNQRELMLAEHVDRLRKEINKRRTQLENRAEQLAGMPTPWRKAKTKSQKVKPRTQPPVIKEPSNKKPPPAPTAPARVMNPAEISLGGDSLADWPPQFANIKTEEDDLVEDVQQPPMKRVKLEVPDEHGGSPRKKTVVPKSDRVLRTRMNSHSEAEESTTSSKGEQRKRGRPRKEIVPIDAGQHKEEDSDGMLDHPVPEGMDPQAPHCICRKPYNPKKFYISCGTCAGWFHGKCVGVTEEATKTMTEWNCPECQNILEEPQEEVEEPKLYCLCQTPYDDTLFYVGCDGCEDWFHPACVGITQEYASTVGEYLCPTCEAQTQEQEEGGYESDTSNTSVSIPLSRADFPLVWRLLEVITEHRMAWPFKEPVDTAQFPNYHEVIQNPIDLSTIQQKLERLEYVRLKDFAHDMNQMFENARIFNSKDSATYLCASTLEKIFEQQLAEAKAEMANRMTQDRRKPSESHTVDSSLDIDTDQLVDVQLDIDPSMYDQLQLF